MRESRFRRMRDVVDEKRLTPIFAALRVWRCHSFHRHASVCVCARVFARERSLGEVVFFDMNEYPARTIHIREAP